MVLPCRGCFEFFDREKSFVKNLRWSLLSDFPDFKIRIIIIFILITIIVSTWILFFKILNYCTVSFISPLTSGLNS